MAYNRRSLTRWLPLLLLLIGLFCFFYFQLYRYLSFQTLQQHREFLLAWTAQHYLLATVLYMLIYSIAVALSIPGATILTLTGGFLFGLGWGVLYVVVSATVGATLLFLAVRTAIGDRLAARASSWVGRMEAGFRQNAFSYLLVLRLVPVFPFWIVNIVSAWVGVRLRTFMIATFLGIIPGTLVYVAVGNGLSHVFASGQTPDLGVIFQPAIFLPLIGLACLALIPVIYQKTKGEKA